MRVVLASRFDTGADSLVRGWDNESAILTPADLSRPGWRFEAGDLTRSTAVVSGTVVPCTAIAGVLTLLPRVVPHELTHIIEPDRRYVASEMTALLLAWLTALRCPVINRPRPGCLDGPSWSPLRWRAEALRAGFRVSDGEAASSTLTLVGGECFGASPDSGAAQRLAAAAGIEILSIQFDRHAAVVSASSRPDLSSVPVAAALLHLLEGRKP